MSIGYERGSIMGNLKAYRKAVGISQEELAAQLGVSQVAVSQWESGRTHPGFEKIIKLSDILGVTIDELVKGA